MFRKLQTALCLLAISGFVFAWCVSGKSTAAVMTNGGNLPTVMDRQVIVLDPGHGGMDGGCVSVDGTSEKGINLAISNDLKDALTVFGFETVCTRTEDVSIHDKDIKGIGKQKKSDMENRLAIFNKYKDAISLSIHQNQFTDGKYHGAQMFYSEKNSEGEKLASAMQQQFVSMLQPDNQRETKPVGDELYLLNNTTCPSLMIECGFLSNEEEAKKLESEDYQKQVAFTILSGIYEYANQSQD